MKRPLPWIRFALVTLSVAAASEAVAGHGNPFSHTSDWGSEAFADPTGIVDGGDGFALAEAAGATSFTSAYALSNVSLREMTTVASADLLSPPPAFAVVQARTSYYDTYEVVSDTLALGTVVSFDVTWTHSGFYGTTEAGDSGNTAAQSEFAILVWSGACSAAGCGTPLSPAWQGADNTFFTGTGALVFDNSGLIPITTLQVGDHFGILSDIHTQAGALTFGGGLRGYSVNSQATIDFSTAPEFSIAQASPLTGAAPEPGTALLLGTGLLGLAVRRRRPSPIGSGAARSEPSAAGAC